MMIVLPVAFSSLNCRSYASKVVINIVSLGIEIWQMLSTVNLIRKVAIKLSILNGVCRKKRLIIDVKIILVCQNSFHLSGMGIQAPKVAKSFFFV